MIFQYKWTGECGVIKGVTECSLFDRLTYLHTDRLIGRYSLTGLLGYLLIH